MNESTTSTNANHTEVWVSYFVAASRCLNEKFPNTQVFKWKLRLSKTRQA